MTTSPELAAPATAGDLATTAAEAVALVLPSAEPLTATGAQPGNEHVAAMFSGAAVVDLDGAVGGRIGILVADDIVAAMQAAGAIDLGAAIQPAFDAAAAVLRGSARAARTVPVETLVTEVGQPFTVVPLIGSGIAAAIAISDATLGASLVSTAPAPAGTPVPDAVADAAAPAADPVAPEPSVALADTTAPIDAAQAAVSAFVPDNGAAFRGIEMLHGVLMDVTVELGRTQLTVRELLQLVPGTVLELDRAAGSPADLLVNGRLIARGEVVVVDEDFGLRVTEIVDASSAL